MPKKRRIIILAGPNGAGKTTFAREYLVKEANCPDFINVDLIAAGLSPFDPTRAAIRAGRIMLSEIERRIRKGESFAFETTLSGQGYARLIPRWRNDGYRVRLMFLSLADPQIAIARVAARVPRVVITWRAMSFVVALNLVSGTSKTSTSTWLISGSGTIIQSAHRT